MSVHNNRGRNALKHAGFSATTILPGESAAEFEKLHEALVSNSGRTEFSNRKPLPRLRTCSGARKILSPFGRHSGRSSE